MKNFVITVIIKQVEAFLLFEMYSIPYGCNLKFVINHQGETKSISLQQNPSKRN